MANIEPYEEIIS